MAEVTKTFSRRRSKKNEPEVIELHSGASGSADGASSSSSEPQSSDGDLQPSSRPVKAGMAAARGSTARGRPKQPSKRAGKRAAAAAAPTADSTPASGQAKRRPEGEEPAQRPRKQARRSGESPRGAYGMLRLQPPAQQQEAREPPGNAPAAKPAPKTSPYFPPAAKAPLQLQEDRARSSDSLEIELDAVPSPGPPSRGASPVLPPALEGAGQDGPDSVAGNTPERSPAGAAASAAPQNPQWFSDALLPPSQPRTGSPARRPAADEPVQLGDTPSSPILAASGRSSSPLPLAQPGQRTQAFLQHLEANAQQRREDKAAAAAGTAAQPQQLSPSPAKGGRRGRGGGRARRQSNSRRSSRGGSGSPSPARLLAGLEVPGSDSPANQNVRVALWEPPVSPFNLIEEALFNDPWRLLVACMLLNKTTGRAVRKILWQLFALAPSPEAAATADPAAVEEVIRPLGLHRRRARMFVRFSQEYLGKDWTDPQQLHGIGEYAADAYFLFCRNQWRARGPPADKDLLRYYEWLLRTRAEGEALEREVFGPPVESASGGSAESSLL